MGGGGAKGVRLRDVPYAEWQYDRPKELLTENEKLLTLKQLQFLDWLTGDRRSDETQNQWERDNNVAKGRPAHWKKTPIFKAAWRERLQEHHLGPDTISELLDGLKETARTANNASDRIRASEVYVKLVEKLEPKGKADEPTNFATMSDEELAAYIEDE